MPFVKVDNSVDLVAELLEKTQLKYVPQEVTVLYDECRRTIGRIFRLVLKHQTDLRMQSFFSVFIKELDLLDPDRANQQLTDNKPSRLDSESNTNLLGPAAVDSLAKKPSVVLEAKNPNRLKGIKKTFQGAVNLVKMLPKTASKKVLPMPVNHPQKSRVIEVIRPKASEPESLPDRLVEILQAVIESDQGLDLSRAECFELITSNSKQIENNSLKTEYLHLMNEIHSQSLHFMEVYSNVLFIHPERVKYAEIGRESLRRLSLYTITVTRWYDEDNPKELLHVIKLLSELENSINRPLRVSKYQNMEYEGLFEDTNRDLEVEFRNGLVYDWYVEYRDNYCDINLQDILRNIGFFDQLIRVLDFDLTFNYYSVNKSHPELLRAVYKFLVVGCKQNLVNKVYVSKFSDIFFEHLELKSNVGVEMLLCEIITYDKLSIQDPETFEYRLNSLCDEMIKRDSSDLTKSILMSIITQMMYVDTKPVKANQDRVISVLFSKYRDQVLGNLGGASPAEIVAFIRLEVNNYKIKFDKKNGKYLIMISPPVCYFISVLELLTSAGEGKNSRAETLSQKIMSIDLIKEVFCVPNIDYVLKSALVQFFYDIYVDIENDMPLTMKNLILELTSLMADDLDIAATNYTKKSRPLRDDRSFLTTTSAEYMSHTCIRSGEEVIKKYILSILDNFIAIAEKEKRVFQRQQRDSDTQRNGFLNLILSIPGKLVDIQNSEIKEKSDRLKEFTAAPGTVKEDFIKLMVRASKKRVLQAQSNATTAINRHVVPKALKLGTEGDGSVDTDSPHKEDGPFSIIGEKDHEKPIIKTAYKTVHQILHSKRFSLVIEKEFEQWISVITKVGDEDDRDVPQTFIDFLSDTVGYFNSNMSTIDESLCLTGLKLLRKFIENGISKVGETAADWDSTVYELHKPKLVRRQNLLLKTVIVEWMCNILQQNRSKLLFSNALLVCIALLYGGNLAAQKAFYIEMQNNCNRGNLLLGSLSKEFAELFTQISQDMKNNNDYKLSELIEQVSNDKNRPKVTDATRRQVESQTKTGKYSSWTEHETEIRLFRFLQLLCEGHNNTLQTFLREQSINIEARGLQIRSVNFVAHAAKYLSQLLKFVNPLCTDIGMQIIDFLIESVQGPCIENQAMLFKSKVIEFIKDFMNDRLMQQEYFEQMFDGKKDKLDRLIKRLVNLLNAILEANFDPKVISYMAHNMNMEFIAQLLQEEYVSFLKSKNFDMSTPQTSWDVKSRLWDDEIREAFDIYFLLKVLERQSKSARERFKVISAKYPEAFSFFSTYSSRVEIVFNGRLIDYYFIIQPACFHLTDYMKESVLNNTSRESPAEKISDFLAQVPALFDFIDDKSYIKSWKIRINPKLFVYMRFMTLMCTLVINGIMAVQFGKRASKNTPITNPEFDEKNITFFSLAVIHLVLTSGVIIIWFLIESRLANIEGWRGLLKSWKKDIVFSTNRNKNSQIDQSVMNSLRKNFYQLDIKERYKIVAYRNTLLGFSDGFHRLEYWVRSWIFTFYDPTLMSLWRFLLASIIGLYFQTQGFLFGYSILMLDVIYWFKTMQNVIFSLTFNGSQLSLAFLLGSLL